MACFCSPLSFHLLSCSANFAWQNWLPGQDSNLQSLAVKTGSGGPAVAGLASSYSTHLSYRK
ncbi:MAG: hypothetical protein AMS15_04650 [Planctomycetes bacterium DG_23]|nr:MAG: hypothetical protein AMS15_04650 [Planctomycetes bacterium DG_23]